MDLIRTKYDVLKDLMPLLLALPVVLLSVLYQRRASFLTSVRSLYESAVNSVQSAIQYTHLEAPSRTEYAAVLKELSTSIELFRGSFSNLGREGERGLFPFEALKEISKEVSSLSYGEGFDKHSADRIRFRIVKLWQKKLRPAILNELDRQTPTSFDSPYWGTLPKAPSKEVERPDRLVE